MPATISHRFNRSQEFGFFDEEDCRYFLRSKGKEVVPTMPFSLGMEEVYRAIVEKYGHIAVPDVTSVLEELLENEMSATGLGDDGDPWRPWRHSWKHRNVGSALSPYNELD